ncbi:MAG: class A beta-lactamase-related serine hydrolase [Clostridiales bacterium]|nr:class A beta-lactamase-related serine hydrolase [Clostridiales bacterium]
MKKGKWNRKKNLTVLLIVLTVAFVALSAADIWLMLRRGSGSEAETEVAAVRQDFTDGEEEATPDSGETVEEADAATPASAVTETPIPTEESESTAEEENVEGLVTLNGQIQEYLAGCTGTWSVYVCDLNNHVYTSVNNQQQRAASLIKLYIMGAVMEKIEAGELEETEEIDTLLCNMITVSDNESSNELVRRLSPDGTHENGMPVVNDFAQRYGYTLTSQGRDLQDVRVAPAEGENYTCVEDCGNFLESVYRGTCVSQEASAKMMQWLRDQTRTWKIPAGLPDGVTSANKTGELATVEDDCAIIFGSDGGISDYILCIMNDDIDSSDTARSQIVVISSMVYAYFQELAGGVEAA